ncbi:MAG: hypothetical protein ACREEE_15800 [Dongiaceae bacterium]
MHDLKPWLRRLSLLGAILLPSFMATCSSGMSSLRINTMNAPDEVPAGAVADADIRAA